MSRQISYAIVADGGTDRALVPIIEWAIHRIDPTVDILEPDFRKRRGTVAEAVANLNTGAMIVFVHRDAEGQGLVARLSEFARVEPKVVPVVPVSMTEAWLLIDPAAIGAAADHPSAVVEVPPPAAIEALSDPKQHLEDLLLQAAGDLHGRRRKKFQAGIVERRINVATLIRDFTVLEQLPAFQHFQTLLRERYPYPAS